MKRRNFMKLMGMASTASLMSSCGVERTTEKLIPFVVPPEEPYIPGENYYYNSTCTECPANCGMSVKVREFNPIKLEGIEGHPINDGALCVRGQASIVRLYHPERIKNPLMKDSNGEFKAVSWDEAYTQIVSALKKAEQAGKKNLFLSGRTTGSLSELMDEFSNQTQVERLPEYEAFSYANIREANNIVFGMKEIPHYKIGEADFLLTIGADIIETFVSPVEFTDQVQKAKQRENFKWLHIQPHASLTGFQSDKLHVNPGSESYLLLFLLNFILRNNLQKNKLPTNILAVLPQVNANEAESKTGIESKVLNDIAQRLATADSPLLITGGVSISYAAGLEAAVLTALLQWVTGMATEGTVDFSNHQNYANVGSLLDIQKLAERLNNSEIGVLFISSTDPLSTIPGSIPLEQNLGNAGLTVAVSGLLNSTAEKCDIVLPLSHTLETWGDAEPRKGLLTVIQPMLEPIFDTKGEGDILLNIMQKYGNSGSATYQEWLFANWNGKYGSGFADVFVGKGYRLQTQSREPVTLIASRIINFIQSANFRSEITSNVLFAVPSIRTFDGKSAAIPLMKEIPDPITTITYGKWLSISTENAKGIKAKDRDNVRVEMGQKSMDVPVKIQPGLAKDTFTIYRDQIDRQLLAMDPRSGEMIGALTDFSIVKTSGSVPFPIMSGGMDQDDREIIPDHYEMEHHHEVKATLYPPNPYPNYRWSMSIDLESCIGCSACVAACYIENNIPVVGPKQQLMGREMSWIRVQPYYNEKEEAEFLLMLCQQCGDAPCETVCPVYATFHNPEGLNAMVYNRCVGTRYCHNNCPYKVRRFNWFEHDWPTPMERMLNPDVYVRPKGVMEKCTFCVQRIRKAKDTAKDEGRKVRDGEITPACAQTCPTEAIVFGNILDKESKVYKKSQSDREFRVLELLGTLPAVHYLLKGADKHES